MLAIPKPQMTFITGEVNKRASLYADMPYGSHYTNDRFQPKRGPAIAIAGAIGTISSGAAIGGFLGGVLIAGGIASAIGGLTGNEFLSNVGMGLSLVGGIGSAVTDAAGNFVNPFTDFGSTKLGEGFSKMGSGIKNFFGDVTSASSEVTKMGIDGGALVSNASDVIPSVTEASFGADALKELGTGGTGINLSAAVGAGAPAAKSGGMLSSLLGNKDLLNVASGLADGYNNYEIREQQQPLIDAQTNAYEARADQMNFETQLGQNRYNNMQAQNADVAKVNPNAQVYNGSPVQGEPKIAVAMNGKVEYLTTEQYAQLQQQNQGGGGLINQGGMA